MRDWGEILSVLQKTHSGGGGTVWVGMVISFLKNIWACCSRLFWVVGGICLTLPCRGVVVMLLPFTAAFLFFFFLRQWQAFQLGVNNSTEIHGTIRRRSPR